MAHRRGSFRRSGISQSQRRKKTWATLVNVVDGTELPGLVTSLGVAITPSAVPGRGSRAGFISITGNGTADDPFTGQLPDECTILRIRGTLLFPKYVATGAGSISDNDSVFAMGVVGIADGDANSYPGAITDSDWDGWMFRRSAPVGALDSTGTVVDVKSMRKVKSGDAFFISVETVPGVGGTGNITVAWAFALRLLILLP